MLLLLSRRCWQILWLDTTVVALLPLNSPVAMFCCAPDAKFAIDSGTIDVPVLLLLQTALPLLLTTVQQLW